jgi:hypothetical protein
MWFSLIPVQHRGDTIPASLSETLPSGRTARTLAPGKNSHPEKYKATTYSHMLYGITVIVTHPGDEPVNCLLQKILAETVILTKFVQPLKYKNVQYSSSYNNS